MRNGSTASCTFSCFSIDQITAINTMISSATRLIPKVTIDASQTIGSRGTQITRTGAIHAIQSLFERIASATGLLTSTIDEREANGTLQTMIQCITGTAVVCAWFTFEINGIRKESTRTTCLTLMIQFIQIETTTRTAGLTIGRIAAQTTSSGT